MAKSSLLSKKQCREKAMQIKPLLSFGSDRGIRTGDVPRHLRRQP